MTTPTKPVEPGPNLVALAEQLRAWAEALSARHCNPLADPDTWRVIKGMQQVADDLDPPRTEGWRVVVFFKGMEGNYRETVTAINAEDALAITVETWVDESENPNHPNQYPPDVAHAVVVSPDGDITTY